MELKTYTVEEIKEILTLHKKWWDDEGDGKRAYLRGAYLRGAYLRGAYLRGAYLRGADLRGADLQGAGLQCADLRGADLRGADLQGADLQCADLQGADLQGAYLRRAYLRGAYLQGADLQCADLHGAKYGKDDEDELLIRYFTVGPIGSRSDYLQVFVTNKRVELRTGCFVGSLEQFSEAASKHSMAEHKRDYLAAVEFIKVMVRQ